MQHNWQLIRMCLVLVVVISMAACAGQPTSPDATNEIDRDVPTATADTNTPTEEPTTPATTEPTSTVVVATATVEEDSVTGSPTPTGASRGIMEPLITLAKEDLAARLDVDVDEIAVVRTESVVWPDSSLGCPQPDMAYTQVQVDGALIVLEVDGRRYNYHSGGGREPFLCENPGKPSPPTQLPGIDNDTD